MIRATSSTSGRSRLAVGLWLIVVATSCSGDPASPYSSLVQRFERAKAGHPDADARRVANALAAQLPYEDLTYLLTMRLGRVPAGQETRLLRDPVFRRAVLIARSASPGLQLTRRQTFGIFTSTAYAQDCGTTVGGIIAGVRDQLGPTGSLIGGCLSAGAPGCIGAFTDAVGDGMQNVIGGESAAEALAECIPGDSDELVDPERYDCSHEPDCDPADELTDEELEADEGCGGIRPTACGSDCCWLGMQCCGGDTCRWSSCEEECTGCNCPEYGGECDDGRVCCDDGTCRSDCDSCGGPGEPCCSPRNWCRGGYDCGIDPSSGSPRCLACGHIGEPCCGGTCSEGACDFSAGRCSGMDAGMDAGEDAGEDAGTDAGDGAVDGAGSDAGIGRYIDCASGPCPSPYICALVDVRTYRCAWVQDAGVSCGVGAASAEANDVWGSTRNNPICVCREGAACAGATNQRPLLEAASTVDCSSVCGDAP